MGHHTDDQLTVLQTLYPWYKEEVYRRREQMMRLTAFASAFLLLVLLTILMIPPSVTPSRASRWLFVAGVLVFSGLMAFLILQQRDRHRMAKQTLIEIERALGLYDQGLYVHDRTLYPTSWQTAWLYDRSVALYVIVLASLSALVIAAILHKSIL